MKFLMLLFSLLPFFNNDFNKKELNMKCQYEEVPEIKYEYGNYSIIEHNDKIEILYSDVRIELVNNIYHYKIIHIDDSLVVFYKNNDHNLLLHSNLLYLSILCREMSLLHMMPISYYTLDIL